MLTTNPKHIAFSLSLLALVIAVGGRASAQPANPTRPRVALVLGGGAARGIAHIGVLREL